MSRLLFALACSLAAVSIQACAPAKITVDSSSELPRYRLETIVVLPFEALATPQAPHSSPPSFYVPPGAKRSDISVAVPPAPDRLTPVTTTVPREVADKVTQLFYEKLRAREGIRVLSPDDARRAMPDLAKELPVVPPQELAKKVASELSADAVLFGRVLVYQERGGSKWGGEPATVGFEVKLLATDGTTLWVGNYYERQQPMNQDLVGFVQHGGVFVTADELVEYGVDRLIKKFPFSGRPH